MPLDPEETPARRALITDGQAQAPAAAPEVVAVRSRRVACDGVARSVGETGVPPSEGLLPDPVATAERVE